MQGMAVVAVVAVLAGAAQQEPGAAKLAATLLMSTPLLTLASASSRSPQCCV